MSFLNKFKKEFEGLNLGERLQQQQQNAQPQYQGGYQNSQGYQNNGQQGFQNNQGYQNNGQQGYQNNGQQGYQNTQGHQSNQGYPNNGQQGHQNNYPFPGSQQSFNGQSPAYQPYNGQQSYPGQQSYNPQGSNYNSSQALQPHEQHRPTSSQGFSHPGPISSPPGYGQPGTVAPYAPGGPPCPTPPRWIAYWSENDRQWCYAETTGRSSWQAPSDLPPLPGMPAYPGSLNMNRGNEGQNQPDQARPSLKEEGKKSSSNVILAAAGGFAAGGVAGYFIKDRIDKHKAKKRHGCVPADFADFSEYPDMDVGLECNVCNQDISGPYAHCKKCDGGDWDVCRDCIAQGETCEGNGEHNLVKVYPKYSCDICDQMIRGDFYHCAWCNNGDWDTCQKCIDKGYTCMAPDNNTEHDLVALYIPNVKLGKGGKKKNNSSDSETDSD